VRKGNFISHMILTLKKLEKHLTNCETQLAKEEKQTKNTINQEKFLFRTYNRFHLILREIIIFFYIYVRIIRIINDTYRKSRSSANFTNGMSTIRQSNNKTPFLNCGFSLF
jgi:hypothetical protein